LKESDLSQPVKTYFESLGYVVNCEVKGCDLVARKDDYLIAIEIKKGFTTKLLFQAMDRQNFADEVYIAIVKPKRLTSDTAKIRRLAKVLNLGLLYVSFGSVSYVDVLHIPGERDTPRKNRRKERTLKEAKGRSLELNQAGITRMKIATAYREKCMAIAAALCTADALSLKELKEVYGIEGNTSRLLQRNYYGWFVKKEKGLYCLKDGALDELVFGNFAEIFNLYLDKFRTVSAKNALPTIDNLKK